MLETVTAKRLTLGCILRLVFTSMLAFAVPVILVLLGLKLFGIPIAIFPEKIVASGIGGYTEIIGYTLFFALGLAYMLAVPLFLGHLLYSRFRDFTLRFVLPKSQSKEDHE